MRRWPCCGAAYARAPHGRGACGYVRYGCATVIASTAAGAPYGWRGRVGLLVPSVNTVVEPEFRQALPAGYSVHAARLRNARNDLDDGLAMLKHLERAADELGSARVDVLALACTTASFIQGREGEREVRERIARAATAENRREGEAYEPAVVTTSGAVIEALEALGIKRVVLVTPYLPEINVLEEAFLAAHSVAVAASGGQPVEHAVDIPALQPQAVYRLAREAVQHAGFQPGENGAGIFLSCTNLPTFAIIDALEADTGLPVVASNQATAWLCRMALGCTERIDGLGRLLRER